MSTFACMLDTCRVYACTVYAMNNSKDPRLQDSFNFGMDLVMVLVLPFIQIRPRVGLSTAIPQNIKNVLVESEGTSSQLHFSSSVALYPSQGKVRKQCEHCKKKIMDPKLSKLKTSYRRFLANAKAVSKPYVNVIQCVTA